MNGEISSRLDEVQGLSLVVLKKDEEGFSALGGFRAPATRLQNVAHRKAREYCGRGEVVGVYLIKEDNGEYKILHEYHPEYSEIRPQKFSARALERRFPTNGRRRFIGNGNRYRT